MYDCLVESDVALGPLGVGVRAYGADLVVLIEENIGLGNDCRKDDVLRKRMCLLCSEHAGADNSQILIFRCCILDIDHLGFVSNGKSLSLGNDEDRSLDLKAALQLITDSCSVL